MIPWADNFIPVIPSVDPLIHTPMRPFCPDQTCLCHELDREAIAQVHQLYQDGLVTAQEATDMIMGRRVW